MQSEIPDSISFPASAMHRNRARRVGVVPANGQHGLFASETIEAAELLLRIEGERTSRPTRYSVQVDKNVHIDVRQGCTPEELIERYAWRFMNHRCEPNTMIRGQDVLAVRRILPLEEVTFNYDSTEYEMAEPFVCHCSSQRCLGLIRGFKYLPLADRERLRPWLAPHLLRAWESEFALAVAAAMAHAGTTP